MQLSIKVEAEAIVATTTAAAVMRESRGGSVAGGSCSCGCTWPLLQKVREVLCAHRLLRTRRAIRTHEFCRRVSHHPHALWVRVHGGRVAICSSTTIAISITTTAIITIAKTSRMKTANIITITMLTNQSDNSHSQLQQHYTHETRMNNSSEFHAFALSITYTQSPSRRFPRRSARCRSRCSPCAT